ncbi:MAG: hypothetical protein KatS3mg057_0770 [Herpetosiphonaceae bacterium]|nr:MAG: hypothetical protein KatS3mg057_0770 [Herpetosiphonaceae bacterium]
MWARVASILLGIWLMAAPAILGYGEPANSNDRIVGPIAATFAAIALWEVTSPIRWMNLPLGLWEILAPMILGYNDLAAILNSFAVGAALALLAAVRQQRTQRFAGGWSALWRPKLLEEHQPAGDDTIAEPDEERKVSAARK